MILQSRNVTIAITMALTLLAVTEATAVAIWTGSFRVVQANPWNIEIIGGMQGHPSKTGLPHVTPDKWECTGRKPTRADVGKTFEFVGYLPDFGGAYSFSSMEGGFSFKSKYSMPNQWVAEGFIEELERKSHIFGITILILFPLAHLLGAFVQWNMSRIYARRRRALLRWLILMNLLTSLLAIPLFFLGIVALLAVPLFFLGIVAVEGLIVFLEGWIIHRLCGGGSEDVGMKIIGFRRALFASFFGNATSVLFAIISILLAALASAWL